VDYAQQRQSGPGCVTAGSLANTLNCCGKVIARAFLRRPAMETSTADHDWLLEEVVGLFDMKKDRSAA